MCQNLKVLGFFVFITNIKTPLQLTQKKTKKRVTNLYANIVLPYIMGKIIFRLYPIITLILNYLSYLIIFTLKNKIYFYGIIIILNFYFFILLLLPPPPKKKSMLSLYKNYSIKIVNIRLSNITFSILSVITISNQILHP